MQYTGKIQIFKIKQISNDTFDVLHQKNVVYTMNIQKWGKPRNQKRRIYVEWGKLKLYIKPHRCI